MTRGTRWLGAACLMGMFVGAMGCSASSQYMKETTIAAEAPVPADRAAVVFMRPSSYGYAVRFRIFDDKKRFMGDALAEARWEVLMEPGKHWFYANGENAGVLAADLAPGARYYVVIRPYMGMWSARVELTGLGARVKDWPKLQEWLSSTTYMQVDAAGGQAELTTHGDEVAEIIEEGTKTWQNADAEWRQEHSLVPQDG